MNKPVEVKIMDFGQVQALIKLAFMSGFGSARGFNALDAKDATPQDIVDAKNSYAAFEKMSINAYLRAQNNR